MPTVAELLNPASSNPQPAAPAAAGGANPFDQFEGASANPFDRFDGPKGASSAAATPAHPKTVGRGIGLGTRALAEAGGSVLDLPANLAIGATNLLYAPVGMATKALGGKPEAPLPYSPFRRAASDVADIVGLPAPQDRSERIQQALAEGIASGAMGAGAAGLLKAAPGAAGAVATTLAQAPLTQAVASGAGSLAAQDVAERGGGPVKQFAAGTVAAMLAGGVAPRLVGEAAVPVAATPAKPNPVARALAPYTSAVSKGAARSEASAVLRDSASNPQAAAAALERPGEIVPGSQPTAFQQSGDKGLGQLERQAMTRDPAAFQQRFEEQNTARREAMSAVETGGDVNDVARSFRAQLEALDAQHQANVDRLTKAAQDKADTALGPDQSPENLGMLLRDDLGRAEDAARANEAQLWHAVDPDGTLTANTVLSSQAAKKVVGDMSPVAKPMGREESAIFEAAQTLPPLAPLRDLIALRSRLSTEMRAELQNNGRTPAYARMSELREAMQDNLSHTIGQEIVNQSPLVVKGQLTGDDALANRLQAWWDNLHSGNQSDNSAITAGRGHGASDRGGASGTSADVPGVRGAAGAADQRPGGSAGNPSLPTQAERAVAEADVNAAREPSPNSLFALVKKAGGVRLRDAQGFPIAGPDIESALQDVRYPGLVNNTSGIAPERIAQSLADAGWFGRNVADPSAAFEAAMAREARGAKVFHPEDLSAVQRQINARLEREMQDAGITARDSRSVAADKLARYRAGQRELADIRSRSGIENAHDMSPEELLGDLQERAAIRGQSAPEADPHGAEFDRLSATRLKPTVDDETRLRLEAATDATKIRAYTYNKGPVGNVLRRAGAADLFQMKDGNVASQFFHPGATGYEDMQALFRAAPPDAIPVIERYAATTLRRAAMKPDGTLDLAKFQAWRKAYADALRALPPSLKSKFETAARAGDAVVQAVEQRTEALKEAQKGAFGKILGLTEPDDVVRTIGQVLNGRTAVADMKALAKATAGDDVARQGLRRAITDYIAREFVGNAEAGTSGISAIKADAYQTFIRKNRAALHLVFTPAEVQSMEAVAADLQRAARTLHSKLPGQSNTAQDVTPVLNKLAKGVGRTWMEIAGAAIGSTGGPLGAGFGALAGASVHGLTAAMKAAGVRRIDSLVSEAMLNPTLARELLKPAPRKAGNFNTGAAALSAAFWASTQPQKDKRR